jgi:catechol 2,3-dioxygenase-like lactoylglutathione lyase family enzyme
MNRRDALKAVAAGLMAAREAAAQGEGEPDFIGLDHIEFYVSNVESSRDLFARIFGDTLRNRNGKRYLRLGSSYMAFEAPRGGAAAGRVDHVSAAIRKLEMAKLHSFLEQRDVKFADYPSGRDTGVNDADGTRLQLSPEDGWTLLNPATFPSEAVTIGGAPIFLPAGIDHVLLNVSNLEKSGAFYSKFLGSHTTANDRVWFQVGRSRIGLIETPTGQHAGVNYFCVVAEAFDVGSAISRLQQLEVQEVARLTESAESLRFRHPDGLIIQVNGPLRDRSVR